VYPRKWIVPCASPAHGRTARHRRPARHRKDVGLVAQLGGLLVGDVVAHEHDAEADSERAGEDRGEREVAEDPLAQAHAVAL
jgi:hypothetical protein